MSEKLGIHGLYVAHLTAEERAWFDAECEAGRAHWQRTWNGAYKANLNGPAYCLATDEDTPCKCGATRERGVCRAVHRGPPPDPGFEIVMVPR